MNPLRRLAATGIERARSTRPISWLTLVGVLLLPALVGGVLVSALYNPTERLGNMTAAIVNNDEPVTIQDQYTPLGRQLSAGLVEGSDDAPSNLTWVLSNDDDAAEGLADGTYQAVVTIPEEFSAAATSSGQRLSGEDATPEQARIEVVTAPDARLADEAITNQVAAVAASSMGRMLSRATLSNVFIGFNTLGEQLGEAADGASQLADGAGAAQDGATELADGATRLADGVTRLGSGAGDLADGAGRLAGGATQVSDGAAGVSGGASDLADGVQGVADGATGLSNGADELADGASGLADGADGVAGGASDLADGASRLSTGAQDLATGLAGDGTAANPGLAPGLHQLSDGAGALVSGLETGATTIEQNGLVPAELTEGATGVSDGLTALSQSCAASGAAPAFCEQLATVTQGATGVSGGLTQLSTELPAQVAAQLRSASEQASPMVDGIARLAAGADDAAAGASQMATGLSGLADGATQLSGGAAQLADGANGVSAGADGLAGGASQLADGAGQAADGATALSGGAAQLATGADGLADGTAEIAGGAGQLASGAGQLSTGADQLADGSSDLGDGIGELAGGTRSLADGLGDATEQLPSYTDREADDLAEVIADPVASSSGEQVSLFGAAAVPLLAAIVLWFGGLASFVVMRSVTGRALTSRRASAALAGGALLPAAVVGAVQGVLVATVVQIASGFDADTAGALFALCTLIGVAFAAVHQALVAVFGGAGRWVAALIGAIALATGIVSTLPGWLGDLAGALPTAPAFRALLGTVTDAGGVGGAVVGLLVWAVLAFAATTIAVARKRTVSTRALLEGAPA
ncbi:YhgE/Pip domain-containing protein [Microbacterium rhizophilus]|uniref:YhgE/Pip domain-containing protein n=1 Tax=Microbacterium rhizophilus TaxID=3138934 RepID=UPI0031F044D3